MSSLEPAHRARSEEDKLVVKNFVEALIFRRKVQGMATLWPA